MLDAVDRETRRRGFHAVGYLAYEAGAAFGLATRPPARDLPLAWFGLYRASSVVPAPTPDVSREWRPRQLSASWSPETYAAAFARIKEHLLEGDCYQVNATFALEAPFDDDAADVFAQLVRTQRGRYAAAIRVPQHTICSASPELFFTRQGSTIVARPMKGSEARGRWPAEDRAAARALRNSAKDRAENVMVVDMVRNDLGRIARTGSVRVRQLCAVERYPTIWQMTSEVAAESDARLAGIFEAMFPSASITGAPKVRVMEVIAALEPHPRGVYTGAIGHVGPDGDATFSVAIRTLVVDHRQQRMSFGVGSGVVWDSGAAREYDECLLKGRVLQPGATPFELLETLAWSPGDGYTLPGRHLDRLQQSAAYFGIPLRRSLAADVLADAVAGRDAGAVVRLLVDHNGSPRAEVRPLPPGAPARVCLASAPIDPRDVFFFHKTTRRHEYERRRCSTCDDVILWSREGGITETTIANLVFEIDGALVTPPVAAGLLAGTFRQQMLDEVRIVERAVALEDVGRASAIWMINSVRGWRRAELVRH